MGFRFANVSGRASLLQDGLIYDLEAATEGGMSSCPMAALAAHRELHEVSLDGQKPVGTLNDLEVGPPVPNPTKAFGVGLNYRAHAEESGMDVPEAPVVFAKYPSCICGPFDDIVLRGDRCDYEAELVVVIGDECKDVPEDEAWAVIAGLTAGQDVSDRKVQFDAKPPQFGLGKSFDTFGPIGPVVVSPDLLPNKDAVPLGCEINGELRQHSDSGDLIFAVPTLISYLSHITRLFPGDLIFTGTPSGVGMARKEFLRDGDLITTRLDGIGEMRNRCVCG